MCSRVHGGHISSTRVSNMYKFLIWRALNTVVHVTADHSACRWSVRMSRRTGSWCHKHSSQYKVCVHAHCSGHSAEMGSRQVQQMTGMVNTTKQTNTLTQCIHYGCTPPKTFWFAVLCLGHIIGSISAENRNAHHLWHEKLSGKVVWSDL